MRGREGEAETRKGQTLGPSTSHSQGPDLHPLFAAMQCPPNSHYEVCADTCSLGCSALSAPPQCPDRCAEGCQCDSGFLSDGQGCVPIQECGCYHNGIYYEVGTLPSRAERGLPAGPPPTACPFGLLKFSPIRSSSPRHGPTVVPFVHFCCLWSTIPTVASKTFLNTSRGPAT